MFKEYGIVCEKKTSPVYRVAKVSEWTRSKCFWPCGAEPSITLLFCVLENMLLLLVIVVLLLSVSARCVAIDCRTIIVQ